MKTTLKLGDTVRAPYGDDTVEGVIVMFSGGWISLDFKAPQKVGRRIETSGVVIHPLDRPRVELVAAGPALTDAALVEVPGHGLALRRAV